MNADEALQRNNLRAIFDHLERTHGFPLTESDENAIKFVYTSFYLGGPELRYSFPRSDVGGTQWFPTYAELMVQTDLKGENHSYLGSAEELRDAPGISRRTISSCRWSAISAAITRSARSAST